SQLQRTACQQWHKIDDTADPSLADCTPDRSSPTIPFGISVSASLDLLRARALCSGGISRATERTPGSPRFYGPTSHRPRGRREIISRRARLEYVRERVADRHLTRGVLSQ